MKSARDRAVGLLVAGGCLGFCLATPCKGQVIRLPFNEEAGSTTTNTGSGGGTGAFVDRQGFPQFSTNVPAGAFVPRGNPSSVDFGDVAATEGGRAIDFPPSTGDATEGLSALSIVGWINARSGQIGPGGNRIISTWPGGQGRTRGGFELVQETNGRLRLGINEAPDFPGPGPESSGSRVTIDPAASETNWVFFAVTYDSTNPTQSTRFYFGSPAALAEEDLGVINGNYPQGAVLMPEAVGGSGTLTIGNFTPEVNARNSTGSGSRNFRGVIDELHVYPSALTLDEIRAVQTVPEPGALTAVAFGLAGLLGLRRVNHARRTCL